MLSAHSYFMFGTSDRSKGDLVMSRFRFTLHCLALCVIASCLMGGMQSKDRKNQQWLYDTLLETRNKHSLPAMGVAFITVDDLDAYATCGVRRADVPDHRVQLNDRWHLGSCTKSMTGTLAARLVDRGVLSWDVTLADVYGEEAVHPDFRPVTLKQLIGHRSGLPRDVNDWPQQKSWRELPRVRDRLARREVAKKPAFPVGSYEYSNLGYVVAGSIMEQATGKSWEELMRLHVFGPLKMRTAGFGAPVADVVRPPRAIYGHVYGAEGAQPIGFDNPPSIGPAGTVHASMEDWGRYVQQHLKGAAGKTRYLDKAQFDVLHAPLPGSGNSYAMGWGANVVDGKSVLLTHNGSNGCWYSHVNANIAEGYAVLVTTNVPVTQGQPAAVELINRVIAEKERWLPAKKPKKDAQK